MRALAISKYADKRMTLDRMLSYAAHQLDLNMRKRGQRYGIPWRDALASLPPDPPDESDEPFDGVPETGAKKRSSSDLGVKKDRL